MGAVENYLARKRALEAALVPRGRPTCLRCRKPELTCYCPAVQAVASRPRIVILMHPLESRHPVGTGRMSHQALANSELHIGLNFDENARVQALLSDPALEPYVLFPGPRSLNLSVMSADERGAIFDGAREPVLFVLDGTWRNARKILHRSPSLQPLPRLMFVPERRSRFRVRKHPNPQFFSTIEAIHEVLTLLSPGASYESLLKVFDDTIERQLSFSHGGESRHKRNARARAARRPRGLQVAEESPLSVRSAPSPSFP